MRLLFWIPKVYIIFNLIGELPPTDSKLEIFKNTYYHIDPKLSLTIAESNIYVRNNFL